MQAEVKNFLRDPDRGRLRCGLIFSSDTAQSSSESDASSVLSADGDKSYLELERENSLKEEQEQEQEQDPSHEAYSDRMVDVVLSDMSAPWDLLEGYTKRSLSNPYRRLMNTSGNAFRDHAGSMVCIISSPSPAPAPAFLMDISNAVFRISAHPPSPSPTQL